LAGERGSAASIALLRDGIPVLGVVHSPLSADRGPDTIAWTEGLDHLLRNGVPVAPGLADAMLSKGAIVFASQAAPGIYGGEAIYATWGRVGPIVDKLKTIGRPAVVHFRLDPRKIMTHVDNPAGRTLIWAWHNSVRSFEMGYWSEGHVTADVPAADILDVECWSPK
jgi:hypothetical protein